MRKLILFYLLFLPLLAAAQAPLPDFDTWRTDGTINDVAIQGETAYIGGSFGYVGPFTGHVTTVNVNTSEVSTDYPKVSGGTIECIEPDGSGGWYIGGTFSRVDEHPIARLAHIRADGTVNTDFNYAPSSTVRDIHRHTDGNLYIAGQFQSLTRPGEAAVTRRRLASIRLSDGEITDWDPNVSNGVAVTMAFDRDVVYVGGTFTGNIGGTARTRLACININTGAVLSWNPTASSTVETLVLSADTLLVGGAFTSVNDGSGATSRLYFAVFDTAGTGTLRAPVFPLLNGTVNVIRLTDNHMYLGGAFTRVFATGDRRALAVLNRADNTLVENWDANISNGAVIDVVVQNNFVAVAGSFTQIDGEAIRNRVAVFAETDAQLQPFNPGAVSGGNINRIALQGSTVFLFGGQWSMGGVDRSRLAALNLSTGRPTSFNPGANSTVEALAIHNNTLYVAGLFSGTASLAGAPRNYLGSIDLATEEITTFSLVPSARLRDLQIHNGMLYIGGDFVTIDGTPRNRLASIDLSTLTLTDWNPDVGNRVEHLQVLGDTLFASGNFAGTSGNVSGQPRDRVAAFNLTTGNLLAWAPNPSGVPQAFAKEGNRFYMGGAFSGNAALPGISDAGRRDYLAAFNWPQLTLRPEDMRTNTTVSELQIIRGKLYVGGSISSAGPVGNLQTRYGVAVFDTATAQLLGWQPQIRDGAVLRIRELADERILMLGGFSNVADRTHYIAPYLALYDPCRLDVAVTGDFTICAPGDAVLTALPSGGDGNYTYRWSGQAAANNAAFQAPTLNIPNERTITLHVNDGSGCDYVESFQIAIATPELTVLSLPTTCATCEDGIVTASVTGGSGNYTFTLNGGNAQQSGVFRDLAAGEYTVEVSDGNTCNASATVSVVSSTTTSRSTLDPAHALRMYPNPAQNELHLNLAKLQQPRVALRITDLSGRTLRQWQAPVTAGTLNTQIAVDDLAAGMYLLHVDTGTSNGSIRFAKQ